MIPIQATIIGFLNKPCSVFAAYDEQAKILVISVEASYRRERRDGCVLITNDLSIDRDVLFATEHFQDAIAAFYALKGGIAIDGASPRLVFSDKAQRANPSDSIEKDGVGEHGQKFRVSDDITNPKVATLAACWYAHYKANLAGDAQAMRIKLAEQLHNGVIISI